MTALLRYLAFFEVAGLAGAPYARVAFARLPGTGAGFGRILGWLLLAWLVWAFGSAGVPNGVPLVVACTVALVSGAVVLHRRRPAPEPFSRRLFITGEVLFVAAFLLAALIGSYASDVWNTEKPMDMMLANATLTDTHFPPHDPWLAGYHVNYYYLGQHMIALTIRLTGVEPSAGYNLALAGLFAVVVCTAFALGSTIAETVRRQGVALKRPLLAGALCVVLLAVMGDLHAGWTALHAHKWATYDWFGASRVIPNTINEFPSFSLMLGDLHAHVLAIPLTLLAVGLIVQAATAGPGNWWTGFCTALSIGWLYAVNSWSWPVTVGLFALGLFVWLTSPASEGKRRKALGWGVIVVAGGILLVLPFIVHFDPNAKGFTFTKTPQREPLGTFLKHHAVIEGVLAWLLVAPLAARALGLKNKVRLLVFGAAIAAVVLPILGRSNLAGAGLLGLLLVATLAAVAKRDLTAGERVLWAIAAAGVGCLFAAEMGTVRDEFAGGPLERMNTVFKMGYQTWLLLAVFGAVALAAARQWSPGRLPRYAWVVVATALIGISLAYPVVGTYARRGAFKGGRHFDGRRWLNASDPGDIGAIDWLRAHAAHDSVVLEAFGDDYSAFGNARISTFTGLQTIVGWQGHELQWGHAQPLIQRENDVKMLYQSKDANAISQLLEAYHVDYAVVGPLERTTYGAPGALAAAGTEVFSSRGTRILRFSTRP